MSEPVPWREAWQQALYGPHGFYRGPGGPAAHFTTATQGGAGRLLAETLWSWADRLGVDGIVDLGAGRGELLRHLYAAAPHRPLAGLDVVSRPPDLPEPVGWIVSPGGAALPAAPLPRATLCVAHEWLDVVPCVVGEVAADGVVRQVLVDSATGAESPGRPLSDEDLEWCRRFWPAVVDDEATAGDRVEVGRQRDEAWAALLDRLAGAPALAVDYGHTVADRPRSGTLAAYRQGRLVDAVPDGSCDLTAHVAVDSLRHTRLLRQRDVLPATAVPEHDLARRDPAAYLAALARSSESAALRRPRGYGDFWWVVVDGDSGATSSRS